MVFSKSGNAVAPDNKPVEVWTFPAEVEVEFLIRLYAMMLKSQQMSCGRVNLYEQQRHTESWQLQREKVDEPHNEGIEKTVKTRSEGYTKGRCKQL